MSIIQMQQPDALTETILERAAKVAAVAATDAEAVDRAASFPKAAIDAARTHQLLGVQIPREFGGEGGTIFDVTDMCYTLGRACASTAMIVAMHQTKVACLVRHGRGSGWHETLMRRLAVKKAAAPCERRAAHQVIPRVMRTKSRNIPRAGVIVAGPPQ